MAAEAEATVAGPVAVFFFFVAAGALAGAAVALVLFFVAGAVDCAGAASPIAAIVTWISGASRVNSPRRMAWVARS